MRSLQYRLRTRAYNFISWLLRQWYVQMYGMNIGADVRISRSAKLDRTNPRGIYIGDCTLISFDVAIISHDFVGGRHLNTYVGTHCFIGARSIIMPGVRVGNHCIVGAGSVVTADVPDRSIAVGNPARVIHSNIVTGRWGIRNPKFLGVEGITPP